MSQVSGTWSQGPYWWCTLLCGRAACSSPSRPTKPGSPAPREDPQGTGLPHTRLFPTCLGGLNQYGQPRKAYQVCFLCTWGAIAVNRASMPQIRGLIYEALSYWGSSWHTVALQHRWHQLAGRLPVPFVPGVCACLVCYLLAWEVWE